MPERNKGPEDGSVYEFTFGRDTTYLEFSEWLGKVHLNPGRQDRAAADMLYQAFREGRLTGMTVTEADGGPTFDWGKAEDYHDSTSADKPSDPEQGH